MGVEHNQKPLFLKSDSDDLTGVQSHSKSEGDGSVYVTINQASEISGYDNNWIWRLANTGKIRYHTEMVEKILVRRIQQIVINLDDLISWEAEKRGPHLIRSDPQDQL